MKRTFVSTLHVLLMAVTCLFSVALNGTAPTFINSEADGRNGYIVTFRGCVPHQCGDGRIGFALYASQSRQTYIAHISTRDNNSYRVTYYPKSGIPEAVRDKLDQMMCSD